MSKRQKHEHDRILEIKGLSLSFTRYRRGLEQEQVRVLDQIDLAVDAGEMTAVIGASGSGKSLLAHAILGLLPDNASIGGCIYYNEKPLDEQRLEKLRGTEIAFVPQSVGYLDPLMKVGRQVRWTAQGQLPDDTLKQTFQRYRLPAGTDQLYPYQLSGGMARRVLVSTATAGGARLIVADEPTPGVQEEDVAEALRHFREWADDGCAVLLISHDLATVLPYVDRVFVLYAGTTVEEAFASDFTGDGERLRHPYSRALWRALPQNGFVPLPGHQPSIDRLPSGCAFAPRCKWADRACVVARPAWREWREGRVRCVHVQ